MTSAQPTSSSKKIIGVVFLTLFLDLAGFSIIFPLFAGMLSHYLALDPHNFFFELILKTSSKLMSFGQVQDPASSLVLFGGILGALYSLLQFVFSPLWGALSDRVGRKPVLLTTVVGLAFSYVLWFFAGSFSLLVLARVVGGMMSGNISTATAIVSDVTDHKTRSKGMAVIGIAFGLGFVVGPAIGALASLIHLNEIFPQLVAWGVNPFSMPALISGLLSLINVILILKYLPETKPAHTKSRSFNLVSLLKPLKDKNVDRTNWINFFFITAFSGMEFTLNFLTAERLHYTPRQNGMMFVFIGVMIALVQGGFVRRRASAIGERKVALMGLVVLMPGLILLAYAHSALILYCGLFFMASGAAMVIPCLTSLVSLYAHQDIQGRAIGSFRSLGALGRVVGPLYACLVFWRLGSVYAYYVGVVLLVLPLLMLIKMPQPQVKSPEAV